jgi:hypothetical protein
MRRRWGAAWTGPTFGAGCRRRVRRRPCCRHVASCRAWRREWRLERGGDRDGEVRSSSEVRHVGGAVANRSHSAVRCACMRGLRSLSRHLLRLQRSSVQSIDRVSTHTRTTERAATFSVTCSKLAITRAGRMDGAGASALWRLGAARGSTSPLGRVARRKRKMFFPKMEPTVRNRGY